MILILSRRTDQSTSDVIKWLLKENHKYVRINYEDILTGDVLVDITNETFFITKNNLKLYFKNISSVWYRRGDFNFKKQDVSKWEVFKDKMKEVLDSELKIVTDYLHFKFENIKQLNSRLRNSVNKLYVLDMAKKVGLKIPKTIITNNRSEVKRFLHVTDKIITKAIYEIPLFLNITDGQARVYTEILTTEKIEKLPSSFGMSLFQEFIEKEFEIRVFYLEGIMYSMALFSQQSEQTKVDFRKYDPIKPNRNSPFELPLDLKQKIDALMKKIKINSGSIDFVYSKNTGYVFLEVNPIGQFGMTSYPCNYPIEKEIAHFLSNK